jgi:alpha-galactosidase
VNSSLKPHVAFLVALFALGTACAPALSRKTARANTKDHDSQIDLATPLVTVAYHRHTGKMDILWRDGHKLFGISSGAQLTNGTILSTTAYSTHTLEEPRDGVNNEAASDNSGVREYTIRSTGPGLPDILQHIWMYDGQPAISIEAELGHDASAIGTRHFDAVMLHGANSIQLSRGAALRLLHVPFDNDMWFRYISWPVAEMKAGQKYSSNEVTAIYDNASRESLILGSITHETWKTAIDAQAADGEPTDLDIYGGISSPTGIRTDTHDTVPHGVVQGSRVVSPRIFIGSYSDWRAGLEAYGAANAAVHPPLIWPTGAPMGWNSWAAYAEKINDHRYLGSAEFVRDSLVPQGFGRNKVVYINLDAFWSNLDAVQLTDAVATIKAMHTADGTHFEPGIYWTPFAYWSDDLDAYVEGTGMKYRYRDILLKAPDGSLLPKVDGGRAIDPSHPGAKERTAYFIKEFQRLGFQYLKLDFLSHGALEGAHFDPAIQTGIEAYNEGMQLIVDEAGGRMFLSLSIAPLFPSGYGHARRLSCDTKGHIGGGDQTTEYMLNSLTYGWWTSGNLYIADPDHIVLGDQADQGARSVTEGKSRLLSAIIGGGMILDSSRLADDPQGRQFATEVYNNRNLFAVANEQRVFRPIEGDTGDRATSAFMRSFADGIYLAVFNYDDKQSKTITVPLQRIDPALAAASSITASDVATGDALPAVHGVVSIRLMPAESKLVALRWQ